MSDSDDLTREIARTIWETSRRDEGTISVTGANIIAAALTPLVEARVREARADELEGFAEYVQRIHPAGLTARTTVIGDALELAARIRNA